MTYCKVCRWMECTEPGCCGPHTRQDFDHEPDWAPGVPPDVPPRRRNRHDRRRAEGKEPTDG